MQVVVSEQALHPVMQAPQAVPDQKVPAAQLQVAVVPVASQATQVLVADSLNPATQAVQVVALVVQLAHGLVQAVQALETRTYPAGLQAEQKEELLQVKHPVEHPTQTLVPVALL